MGFVEGEGGDGHLFCIVLLLGVGLNSSRLLLREEVRLVVGLSGGGGGWWWGGGSQVGAWAGLEAGMSLWLTDFKVFVRDFKALPKGWG